MPNLQTMSGPKLLAHIEALAAINMDALKAAIAAGYGDVTGNQMREMLRQGKADSVVRRLLETNDALREARHELDARRSYHGEDKPIRRYFVEQCGRRRYFASLDDAESYSAGVFQRSGVVLGVQHA